MPSTAENARLRFTATAESAFQVQERTPLAVQGSPDSVTGSLQTTHGKIYDFARAKRIE
jgi:hypothetical protein